MISCPYLMLSCTMEGPNIIIKKCSSIFDKYILTKKLTSDCCVLHLWNRPILLEAAQLDC